MTAGQQAPEGRVLITGIGGFVGRHLATHLLEQGDGHIAGLVRPNMERPEMSEQLCLWPAELIDAAGTEAAVRETDPGLIYHLAAQASVADSLRDPLSTLFNNIAAQVNLLEAAARLPDPPRVLVVGSSEEYGQVQPDELPIRETNELRPLSPYAVSKVAQDLLGFQYSRTHRLPIVRVRSFTHFGPGQEPRFVTAAFARQIARVEAGLQPPVLSVGNLSAQRDLTDVRDVVRAYRLILLHGEPGEVYNVGSGRLVSVQSLLDQFLALSSASIRVEVDPARFRAATEAPQSCDYRKLHERTGWQPQIPIEQTLADILDDWRDRVARLGDAA